MRRVPFAIPGSHTTWRRLIVLLVLPALFLQNLCASAADDVVETKWEVPPAQVGNRLQIKHLHALQQAIAQKRQEDVDWLNLLPPVQAILANPEDSYVTSLAPGSIQIVPRHLPLSSLKDVADRMLGAMPPRGIESWRNLYEAVARSKLDEADSPDELASIALQYPHTSAAHAAAARLGTSQLDQRHSASALFWLNRLRRSPDARSQHEPLLSMKIAAAWTSLGRNTDAVKVMRDLLTWLDKHPEPDSPLLPSLAAAARAGDEQLLSWIVVRIPTAVPVELESGWTHFLGNSSRSGAPEPVNPLTGPAWRSSTIGLRERPTEGARQIYWGMPDRFDNDEFPQPENNVELAAAIERGLEILSIRDAERKFHHFPATHPVIVGDRVVFRTLNRVRCADLQSGETIWETFTDDPGWADLFDLSQTEEWKKLPVRDIRSAMNQFQDALLRIRTREDRTLGMLTADERRVYFVDECGVPERTIGLSQRLMTRASPQPFNRLCAADLETGQLRWEIGGPRDDFALEEAGAYFLGPPTIVDDELYVLAERDAAIRLLCLDRDSGRVKTSQPVSQPIESVERLSLRRISGDSPTRAADLLLCPTTSGMIIAWSPQRKRIAWSFSYATSTRPVPRSRRFMNTPTTVSSSTMDSRNRWNETTILTASGRAVIAPVDANELFCIDLLSGRLLWKSIRNKGLSLACVTSDLAVVATSDGLQAFRLEDGKSAWDVRLDGYVPIARGIRVGSLYHLPCTLPLPANALENLPPKGILTIDLKSGRVLIVSPVDDPALAGNLAAFKGTLISAGFNAVAAFDPLGKVQQQLVTVDPSAKEDAGRLAVRGRLALHHGRTDEGIDDLRTAALLDPKTNAQSDLVFSVLEKLRRKEIATDRAIELLDGVEITGHQKSTFNRLRAESLARSDKPLESFTAFIELAQSLTDSEPPIADDNEPVAIGGQRWVAAQLAQVYENVRNNRPGELPQFEAQINRLIDEKPDSDSLRLWLKLFAWHGDADAVRTRLAARLSADDADGNFIEAEQLLRRAVSTSTVNPGTADAHQHLIDHWIRGGHAESAVAAFDGFRTRWREQSPGGLNPDKVIEDWSKLDSVQPLLKPTAWTATTPVSSTEPVSTRHEHRYYLPVIGDPGPAFSGWTFEINLVRNVFLARGPLGRERWSIRITGPDGGVPRVHPAATSVHCQGHLVVLSMSSRILVYDASGKTPIELWSRSLLPRDNAQLFLVPRKRRLGGYWLQTHDERPVGSVDLVQSDSIVYRKGRVLFVAQLANGRILWQRDDVDPESIVLGNERSLAVIDLQLGTAEMLSLFDGRSEETSTLPPIGRLIAATGRDPVIQSVEKLNQALKRIDSRTGKTVWSHQYPPNALMQVIQGREMVILQPDGLIHLRDLDSGELTLEARGNGFEKLSAFHVLGTRNGFVLLTNVAVERSSRIPVPLGLQGVVQPRVNGEACGIDRKRGLVWSRNLDDQLISLSQPRDLPTFALASERRIYNEQRRRIETISFPVELIDSRTGKTVFKETLKKRTMGYRITADPEKQSIQYTFDSVRIDLDYSPPQK